MITHIASSIGLSFDAATKVAVIPCDGGGKDNTIDFYFSELTIKLPLSEFVVPFDSHLGRDDKEWCALYSGKGGKEIILGDDFLRSVYVVYDLSNFQVSMANINTDGGDVDIHEIIADEQVGVPATKTSAYTAYELATAPTALTTLPKGVELVTLTKISDEAVATSSSGGGEDSAGTRSFSVSATLVIAGILGLLWF